MQRARPVSNSWRVLPARHASRCVMCISTFNAHTHSEVGTVNLPLTGEDSLAQEHEVALPAGVPSRVLSHYPQAPAAAKQKPQGPPERL